MTPSEASRNPTVLVVNDDPSQLRLTVGLLEKDGWSVLACEDVEEALRVLSTHGAVDVIVTDLQMPGLDGWHFCWLLRSPEYAAFNHIPILAMSSTYSDVDAAKVTLELGANAFLRAPYQPSELRTVVRQLLHGHLPQAAAHILLIDDVPQRAERLREQFAAHGYAVHIAPSVDQSRAPVRRATPDAVIVDDRLLQGVHDALLDELRDTSLPPVVLVIAREHDPARAVHLMKRGVDGYVAEPFAPEYVIGLCQKARRQRSLQRVEDLLEERTRALRDSEAQLRALFQAIPDAVLVRDDSGVILQTNAVAAAWLETMAAELVGRSVTEFTQLAAASPAIGRPPTEGPRVVEATWVSSTGRRLDVEISEQRIEFRGRAALLCVARDLTVRTALLRQRADYLAMLTNDIRVPLEAMSEHTAALRATRQLGGEAQDILARLEADTQTVLQLINDYLRLESSTA